MKPEPFQERTVADLEHRLSMLVDDPQSTKVAIGYETFVNDKQLRFVYDEEEDVFRIIGR